MGAQANENIMLSPASLAWWRHETFWLMMMWRDYRTEINNRI